MIQVSLTFSVNAGLTFVPDEQNKLANMSNSIIQVDFFFKVMLKYNSVDFFYFHAGCLNAWISA